MPLRAAAERACARTVAELRPVLAGERGPGGFKLETPPAQPVPIYIAALRDRMLRLGGEVGDGTFVNFLPLVARSRTSSRRSQPPEGHDVVCRFFCIPQPLEEGLAVARFMFAGYATVPVYEAFFRGLGWGDAIDPMVDGLARRATASARRGARAGGAAARGLRVRRAGGDARAAARVRRRRHDDALPDAAVRAGAAART